MGHGVHVLYSIYGVTSNGLMLMRTGKYGSLRARDQHNEEGWNWTGRSCADSRCRRFGTRHRPTKRHVMIG